jgi:hypothetical protein
MDLLDKGDVEVDLDLAVLKVTLGQPDKINGVLNIPLGYLVDKLEEVIPGDQKGIAAGLKAALKLL